MKKLLAALVTAALFLVPMNAIAAVKAGATCSKLGATSTYSGKKYTCIKSGKKLVWNKGVAVAAPKPTTTPSPVTQPKPVKVSDSAAVSNSLVNATVLAITGTKVTTAIKLGKSVAAKLTSIPVGTKVTSTLKNAKGQVFALPTKTVGNSKTYSSAAVKPKLKGTYTIAITYGKVKKTLVIVVK
jgi:hypothetical protein